MSRLAWIFGYGSPLPRGTTKFVCSLRLGGAREKVDERGAVLRRADALLGHFGAGREGCGPEFEQPGNRFRRPHQVEMPERLGIAIAGNARDVPAEDAIERRACAIL